MPRVCTLRHLPVKGAWAPNSVYGPAACLSHKGFAPVSRFCATQSQLFFAVPYKERPACKVSFQAEAYLSQWYLDGI